ncbi:unnamed protein product [Pleuronectes platessa]|uniref:Uncharacterized protein n=1 Tax=Pleuronectes platessa TaxID=8262 RepID=A0A9N7Y9S0_PLEPL|nr:unnamed protein product [Pleuronectes platessa]
MASRASDWDRAQPSGREEADMLDTSCGGEWEEFHIGSIERWDKAGGQDQSQAHHPSFKARKYGQKAAAWKRGQKLPGLLHLRSVTSQPKNRRETWENKRCLRQKNVLEMK